MATMGWKRAAWALCSMPVVPDQQISTPIWASGDRFWVPGSSSRIAFEPLGTSARPSKGLWGHTRRLSASRRSPPEADFLRFPGTKPGTKP